MKSRCIYLFSYYKCDAYPKIDEFQKQNDGKIIEKSKRLLKEEERERNAVNSTNPEKRTNILFPCERRFRKLKIITF